MGSFFGIFDDILSKDQAPFVIYDLIEAPLSFKNQKHRRAITLSDTTRDIQKTIQLGHLAGIRSWAPFQKVKLRSWLDVVWW